ncbi:MAG: hypothetical protein PVI87_08585 [Gammaproteobacteria bacterium]|jgi:hypothetical protein
MKERFPVLHDVIVFQFKLIVDGLRDLLISPVSVFAALIDLLVPGDDGGKRFYAVVRYGRRTEQWINLFGAADQPGPAGDPAGMDVIIADLEEMVRDPARREEARARAQALVDRLKNAGKDGPR